MSVVSPYNNSNDARIGGDDDHTGAMLNMLAEVAAQTLRADNEANSSPPSPPTITKRKRSKESSGMPLNQARMLSGNQLVRTFSRAEGDELRRLFSFQCLILPRKCRVRFESFGSETKARNLIKDHLLAHLDELPEGEILQVPKPQDEPPYKRATCQVKSVKKIKANKHVEVKPIVEDVPIEIPIFPVEMCREVVVETEKEPEPATSSNVSVALAQCYGELQVSLPELSAADHDYYRSPQGKVKVQIGREEYTDVETIWIKSEEEGQSSTGITDYIVSESNVEEHPMLAVSNEVEIKTESEGSESTCSVFTPSQMKEEIITIKSEEMPVLLDNRLMEQVIVENGCVERDEHRQQKKPKGKAKFIGQSAAEKEMAVRMIDMMKLKQGVSEPLECQICVPARVFTAPTTLISHYRSHAGIKPYECHLCGGVFTRQHSLNYHLLIHSNKTRFTCSDCGRKFRHPSHFKEHQRRHTGEAPFECSDCVIRFKTRNTYKRHLKTRHGKVLTQSGGIVILSEEEFRRVRTAPRSLQTRVSSDKENNRRPRPKVVNLLRKKKKNDDKIFGLEEGEEFIQKYTLSGNWTTNLLEPEMQMDATESQVAILQAVGASGGTPVIVLSGDNIIYNNISA